MRKKGGKNKKYSPEYKANVILDISNDQISMKEYIDPFTGNQEKENK